MAWGRRTSPISEAARSVGLACTVGVSLLCIAAAPLAAQTVDPPAAAAKAAPTKAAAKKPKTKPAATEAKVAKKDPAVAQQEIDAGVASLQAGKTDLAVQQLTSALTGGSLPAPLLARAHYHRGLAYRKQTKTALAISDLTQALWVKNGLAEADRADAMQNRIAAYRDAGLPDQADAESVKSTSTAVSRAATAAAAPAKVATAESAPASVLASTAARTGSISTEKPTASLAPAPDPAPSTDGGGLGGFFGNLFGGSSGAATAAPVAQAAPAKTEVASSAWSAGTEVKAPAAGAKVKPTGQTAALAAPVTAPGPKSNGRYVLQVAKLKTREDAQSVAAKLKQQLGLELAGREASIVAVSEGGFGTLHRLSFGPFADAAEWKTLCPKLLKAGHDCQPVTQ